MFFNLFAALNLKVTDLFIILIAIVAAAIIIYVIIFISIKIYKAVEAYKNKKEDHTVLKKASLSQLNLEERIFTLSEADRLLYEKALGILSEKLIRYTTNLCEIFFKEDKLVSRLIINRGAIRAYFALNPLMFKSDKVYDVSDEVGYELMPSLLILREESQLEVLQKLAAAVS